MNLNQASEPKKLPSNVVAIVLGGGRGTRLHPLTLERSKPAVPLAGKYRLVDVAISNCINSGIRKIYVLTQFNSASLNRHIAQTYKFDAFSEGFVEILAAEQTPETENWYQGTADAVRKTLRHIQEASATHVLVLAGDALYRENFQDVLEQHKRDSADITVECKLVSTHEATAFGVVGIDETRKLISYHEKPSLDRLAPLRVDPQILQSVGLHDASKPLLASMGIYLFNREVLVDVLRGFEGEDFGREIIPAAIPSYRVMSYLFSSYWEDIGTIKTFFWANLNLLSEHPQFSFYDQALPIYTHSRLLPSSQVIDSHIAHAMLAEGCLIDRADIRTSIIGIRSVIGEGAKVENTVMMGADFYETTCPEPRPSLAPPMGIGRSVIIRNAIIDKNTRIGEGAQIVNAKGVEHADGDCYCIRDGIVIIPKNTIIPPGKVI